MSFKKTNEQINIDNDVSNFLAIKAFAGTGKTTTLKEFAISHSNSRILYVAYNKETAKQAKESFPSNVTSRTAHSLAFFKYGKKLENKLNRKYSLPFKPETIRKLFGFKRTQASLKLANELYQIINNYCYSSYKDIRDSIPFKRFSDTRENIEFFCNELWENMTDPNSRFPTTPDVYLKLFHLSNPRLSYDYILFDEAQDANPLILDLILSQKKFGAKLVFVGDEHQSIYGFRGAKNSLNAISPDKELYLTKSFRFGSEIAYAANAILKTLKDEKQTLVGYEEINDYIGIVDKTKPFSVITRTNAHLFMNSIAAYEQKRHVFFVGGFESYNFKKILDLEYLFFGETSKIKDSYIRTFNSYNDYVSTANFTNDREMIYFTRVIEKHAGYLSDIIKGIKDMCVEEEDADIILSTVHKSKGLEFNQVVLGTDFPLFVKADLSLNMRNLHEDEINILYVAATRAIECLQPNKTLTNIISLYKKIEVELKEKHDKELKSMKELPENKVENTMKNVFISGIENQFN